MKNSNTEFKITDIYPVCLLSLWPFLQFINQNLFGNFSYKTLFGGLLVFLCLSTGTAIILSKVLTKLANKVRAIGVLCVGIILFFNYVTVSNAVQGIEFLEDEYGYIRQRYIFLFWIVLSTIVLGLVWSLRLGEKFLTNQKVELLSDKSYWLKPLDSGPQQHVNFWKEHKKCA